MGEVNARAQLLEVVRQVRRRWRIKLALRGAVGFLLAGLIAILAIAYTLEALKFSPDAIFWFRIVTALVFVAAGAWFFARPLSRKVTDEQVALYLEEHEPSLDSDDPERDGSDRAARRLVAGADPPPRRERDRARARNPGRRAHRARADETLRLGRRRGGRGGRSPSSRSARRISVTRCRRSLTSRATSRPRRRTAST